MKKILLCCAGGASSSLLVTKMQGAAKEINLNCKIWAVGIGRVVKNITEENGVDIVMVGPQVRYKLNSLKKDCGKYDIPINVINMNDYGRMNGKNVLKTALELIEKHNN